MLRLSDELPVVRDSAREGTGGRITIRDPLFVRVERARAFGAFDGFWPPLVSAAAFMALLYAFGGL